MAGNILHHIQNLRSTPFTPFLSVREPSVFLALNQRGLADMRANNRSLADSRANNRGSADSRANNRGLADSRANNRGSADSRANHRGSADSRVFYIKSLLLYWCG